MGPPPLTGPRNIRQRSRTVRAGGEVGDAEGVAGGEEDGARGRHAVQQGEDLQFGFEFVGNEVDGEVGIVDGVFDGGDETDLVAEFGEVLPGVAKPGRA